MCARATLFHGVVCVERANICTAGAAARASTFSPRSIHVYVSPCIRMFTCARICGNTYVRARHRVWEAATPGLEAGEP